MKPAAREQAVFAEALQYAAPEARAACLDVACGTDHALRRRIEALLRAAENMGGFLEQPPTGLGATSDASPRASDLSEHPGDRIGRYKLLERIGEGGCGVVYMSEQEEPVRRRVALKVIKLGMDTRSVVARFEAERQALAMMDHPNIAKVLDGGATQTGLPYFVMELVRGVRITEFCDEARLSTRARLLLFVQVCQAVQHAHQKGIIHRDLKPSNILVTVNDGAPVPKVIDFGIAKATGQRLTDKTLFTHFHSFIGTPAYTSPEQAEMSSVDVDTRSDIYSLGVLLYELLTGKTPFDGEELLRSGLDEMRRTIRETEPPRPSTRLTSLFAAEARRRTSKSDIRHPASEFDSASSGRLPPTMELISAVRGDLDWIVMKCLEKDRARRYETANGLAADVERHLNYEPIRARPVNVLGRLWRWRLRHPAVAALSASVLLLLMVVAVGSTVAAWRVASARRAEHAERTRAEAANRELRAANTRLADTVSLLELRRAEDLFRVNDASAGVAHLSAILRRDPSNHVAASRLVSALVHRNWALPAAAPMRHLDRVTTANFSPDGRHVLSAGWDKTAQIRDAATGQLLVTFQHQGIVLAAQYNRLGDRVVTASADGAARIWNATNGVPVTLELRHDGEVNCAEYSPDGQSIVTGSGDGTARIWDAAGGALKQESRGHSSGITTVRFSPDGGCVATGTERSGIHLWHADTGAVIFRLTDLRERINALAFSPDGRLLVSAGADNTARLWNATSGQAMGAPILHTDDVHHVVFSPDGRRLLTASEDHSARLWNATNGVPTGPPMLHGGGVTFGAFSPDGQTIVTTSMDNSARLWEVATATLVCQPLPESEAVLHAAFSPDGERLLTTSANRSVQVWSIRPRRFLGIRMGQEDRVAEVAFDPRGESVLIASPAETARMWNTRTGEAVGAPMRHRGAVRSAEYGAGGRRVVTASEDGTACVWDSATGRLVAGPLQHAKSIRSAQFSPDGERVATASADGTARIWDARSGQPVTPPLEHGAEVTVVRFSPDGRSVVTGSANRSARVWNAQTGQPATPQLQHLDEVGWAEFNPDGERVVSASHDNSARLWNARTGQPIGSPMQHARTVQKAVFSPDGRRVLTASLDRMARVWDATTGEALTAPLAHDRSVAQACFSPDGRRILTSCWAATSRLWDTDTGRPLSEWLDAGGPGFSVCFDSTGERIVSGTGDGIVRVWDAPPVPTPVPSVFLTLAEAVAGIRLSANGNVELVSRRELGDVARRLAEANMGAFYESLGRWLLADPGRRPASPF